jgi:hypothetical protein
MIYLNQVADAFENLGKRPRIANIPIRIISVQRSPAESRRERINTNPARLRSSARSGKLRIPIRQSLRMLPLGYRLLEQNAIVHAASWSSGNIE